MQKLTDFYKENVDDYLDEYRQIRRRLRIVSFSRLLAFSVTVLATYLLRNTVEWAVGTSVIGIGLFLFLVRYYEDLKTKFRLIYSLVKINETELQVLNHDFDTLPSGDEFLDAQHEYSHDIDLFGQGSFFQYLNRTQLPEGKVKLANLMTANAIDSIPAKQEAIDELAQMPKWRQQYTAQASLMEHEVSVAEVNQWLKKYRPFVSKYFRIAPLIFLFGTVLLGFGTFLLGWSYQFLLFWILLGLGITSRYYSKILKLSQQADKVKSTFKQHSKLLEAIEGTELKAPQLRFQKQRLQVMDRKASEIIGAFSRLLNTMDYNNNIFYAIFGNGCFLGALWTAYEIEVWIKKYGVYVSDWFEVIAFFEAYNSLGNFSFNHPLYSYPILTNGPNVFTCAQLGHPLIKENKNVRNDFDINDEQFFIITGSNMAGKSTFLRSVGLGIIMANLGLPVYAHECVYSPRKLVTSMRSVDSLYKGDSYFFSELKRLKKVVQKVEKEDYFVLLDEILKGTNSHDKAEGSKKFLARLVKAKSTGLIATHDLSLCETANEHQNVSNYHLDATIENDELSFDYKLKKGVSKTMNASFLLKKMDLI